MSSFDQVIKNILADIFAEEEQQEVTRPRARPEGLMSSTRPRARPEDVEPVQPSASESTSKFVAAMSDYDDTPEEGAEIPLADLRLNARDMEGRYKTTAAQFYRLNKNIPSTGSKVKVAKVVPDIEVDDITNEINLIMSSTPSLRPRARPKSAEEIQAIRAEQASYTKLDTVKDIQQALNIAGIEVGGKPLVVDGIKGRNTLAAIKAFQKREGLKVDGIVGKNTKAALYKVMPKPEIKEEELQPSIYDKPAQVGPDQMQVGFQDPSIVDPTTGRPYTSEGLMRREQYLVKRANEFLTSEDYTVSVDQEDAIPVQTPNIKTSSILPRLNFNKEVSNEIDDLNAIEKVKALGYIKNQYTDFLLSPSFTKAQNIIADIKSNRYGGYASNLDENNLEDAKVIEQFFKNAIGKNATFDATSEAWCALFVDHILNEMGADRLGSGQGGDVYDRVRARAYENYGNKVLGKSPTEKDFNANAKVGDILVIHSSFVVKKPDGKKQWFSVRDVEKTSDGKYVWKGDPSDDIMQAEIQKMNDGTYNVSNQYHVGFNVGKAENGMLEVLGGNQNDQVNVRGDAYNLKYVMAVRRVTSETIKKDLN
jgi:hypothetical protein